MPSDAFSLKQLGPADFDEFALLLTQLMGDIPLAIGPQGRGIYEGLINHGGTSLWGLFSGPTLCSTATLHLMPNLTHAGRPYGLIENVITERAYRGQGLGRRVMDHALETAWAANAYKVMLMTNTTARAQGFYKKLGFSDTQKDGMIIRRTPTRKPS
ncbi:GNAT family N-acetyltransferase [Algirhabdus cladophorae]|uniref:GNAT family N-acetyltransferase n=1 Tax=Algirhabdus cladophorae TaxID=3377108 RepID=UPI003B8490F8